eukprot:COSAG02_NODE_7859_length_2814_cov_33.022657_5_plen_42_part_01
MGTTRLRHPAWSAFMSCLRLADSFECVRADAVLDGLMSLDGV